MIIGDLMFKPADASAEFEQIHHLNYLTFVREIGQHPDPGRPALIDKYHAKNLYLIAKRAERVIAMVAIHDQAPFSVAARIPEPAWIERHCAAPLEVRLLTIASGERQAFVLPGLLWLVFRVAQAVSCSHLLASGVRQQLRLYRRLGFEPLGPEAPCGAAWFTPLALPMNRLSKSGQVIVRRMAARART